MQLVPRREKVLVKTTSDLLLAGSNYYSSGKARDLLCQPEGKLADVLRFNLIAYGSYPCTLREKLYFRSA
jgi:hypothetical protein